jgi:selT/selW/selH-like putative selenoprotein
LKKSLLSAFKDFSIELKGGRPGSYEIDVDGKVVYSKLETGDDDFPENSHVISLIQTELKIEPVHGEKSSLLKEEESGGCCLIL